MLGQFFITLIAMHFEIVPNIGSRIFSNYITHAMKKQISVIDEELPTNVNLWSMPFDNLIVLCKS